MSCVPSKFLCFVWCTYYLYYCIIIKECRSAEPEKSFQRMTVGHTAALNSGPGGQEEVVNRRAPSLDDNNHLDIEELKRKLEETESAMTKIIARMSQIVPKTTTQVSLMILYYSHPVHIPCTLTKCPCPASCPLSLCHFVVCVCPFTLVLH